MPEPREGEQQSAYISRCVKQVMGEGKDQKAALGQCYGMWRQKHGGKAKLFCETIKQQPGPGQTHQQTALGNERAIRGARGKPKKERQLAVMAAAQRAKQPAYGGSTGDTDIGTEKRGWTDEAREAAAAARQRGAAIRRPGELSAKERALRMMGFKPGEEPDWQAIYQRGVRTGQWTIKMEIKKAEPERQMIFGWASVVAKDGNYIIDKQGDIIPIHELENAVFNYMLESREHGVMHAAKGTGRLVMSMLTTPDIMNAFGLTQKDNQIGWIAGYKIEDPALWEAHKRGLLPEFSIGGSSVPFEQVDDESPPDLTAKKARGERIKRPPFRRY